MKKIIQFDKQIIFTIVYIAYLLFSVLQYLNPLTRQDGDSSGLSTLNEYFIFSYILLSVGALSVGIKTLLKSKLSNFYVLVFTGIVLFIVYKLIGILILPLLILISILDFFPILFSFLRKELELLILFTILPLSLGAFIFAGSIFSLFGLNNLSLWLPEILATNIVSLLWLVFLWYLKIKKLLDQKKSE
jgi:hypothetical protein